MIAWQGVSTTGAPHIVGCKNTSVGGGGGIAIMDRVRGGGGTEMIEIIDRVNGEGEEEEEEGEERGGVVRVERSQSL